MSTFVTAQSNSGHLIRIAFGIQVTQAVKKLAEALQWFTQDTKSALGESAKRRRNEEKEEEEEEEKKNKDQRTF